jgi:hypothetical protein
MKNAVFWDVPPYGSCRNRRFGRMHHLHHQGDKNLCVTVIANVPSSLILFTLKIGALRSFETRFLQEPHGATSQKMAFFTDINYVVGPGGARKENDCLVKDQLQFTALELRVDRWSSELTVRQLPASKDVNTEKTWRVRGVVCVNQRERYNHIYLLF